MRNTTFTESEEQLLIDECWRALADGTRPLSKLTDHLLSLTHFGFLRTRLAESDRRITMNCVGNPLSMDDRFSSGPTFTNAHGYDDTLRARIDVALNGLIFTTQLSIADVVTGALSLDTDLVAFYGLLEDIGEFTINGSTGSRSVDPATDRCELRGGDGWLDDFPPGCLLTVTWLAGDLRVARHIGAVDPGATEAHALLAYAEAERAGHGFSVYEPIIKQITVEPAAYRSAVPPVSELLLAGGFEQRNGWFGRAGTDWHHPDIAKELELRVYVGEKNNFGSCCFEAYEQLLELWQKHLQAKAESSEPDISYSRVGELLAHAAVADGFDDCLSQRDWTGGDIQALVRDFLRPLIHDCGPATSAARYLVGKMVERQGNFDHATRLYEIALEADRSYSPPCTPLAWLAFDRSEFNQARELLTRSGLEPRSPEFSFLPARVGGRSKPARNECCPCGSGRKYKTCHADTSLLSPWQRLQLKHNHYAATTKVHVQVAILTLLACDIDVERADSFQGDLFLTDIHRFEGNGLADFARIRGSLFPADERQFLDQLDDTRRMLYEVTHVDDGLWLRGLADVNSPTAANAVQFAVGSAQLDLRAGDHILARLLQADDSTAVLIGEALRVPAAAEESLRAVLSAHHTLASPGDDDAIGESLAAWYVNDYATALADRALGR